MIITAAPQIPKLSNGTVYTDGNGAKWCTQSRDTEDLNYMLRQWDTRFPTSPIIRSSCSEMGYTFSGSWNKVDIYKMEKWTDAAASATAGCST